MLKKERNAGLCLLSKFFSNILRIKIFGLNQASQTQLALRVELLSLIKRNDMNIQQT